MIIKHWGKIFLSGLSFFASVCLVQATPTVDNLFGRYGIRANIWDQGSIYQSSFSAWFPATNTSLTLGDITSFNARMFGSPTIGNGLFDDSFTATITNLTSLNFTLDASKNLVSGGYTLGNFSGVLAGAILAVDLSGGGSASFYYPPASFGEFPNYIDTTTDGLVVVSAVPEPSTLILAVTGGVAVLGLIRRRFQ